MREQLAKVKRFHEAFGCHVETEPNAEIPRKVFDVRVKLFQEELEEYRRAGEAGDVVAIADALTDMLYVLLGTYISHGLQEVAVALFDEVHRSNMSKLDAHGRSVLRWDGKVMKSAQFSEPDLAPILSGRRV